MIALLLNSGVGRRMGDLTVNQPKCMTPIGAGYTIISRQLTLLAAHGVTDIVITTGPFEEELKAHIDSLHLPISVIYVPNPRYAQTNYIYSMLLAKDVLKDDILLLHGDLVVEDGVYAELIAAEHSAMAVDRTLSLPEKDFKARVTEGKVVEVSISIFDENCFACQPAYKWRQQEFARWMAAIEEFCAAGTTNVYAENAFNAQNGAIPLFPLWLEGRLCHEIDTPEDLTTVSALFLRSMQ